jgi:hypothetical protein
MARYFLLAAFVSDWRRQSYQDGQEGKQDETSGISGRPRGRHCIRGVPPYGGG